MSGADTQQQRIKRYLMSLPGKRGIDIPEKEFDQIHEAASGHTLSVWGRHPTAHQLQHFYDQGMSSPDEIGQFYGQFPHPYVPQITVGEYPTWAQAYTTFRQHGEQS